MRLTTLQLTAILCLTALAPALRGQEPLVIPAGYVVVDDMILPEGALSGDSSFSGTPWTGGIVYYTFDPNVAGPDSTVAIDAMAEWSASANVTFTQRTTQPNWVNFKTGTVNLSYVGMVGGKQDITIYNWNYRFIVCHEIAHALGCCHEQQRPNRDTYVTINTGNILAGELQNFTLMSGAPMYGAYDFDSLMHYGQYDFTSNGQPTITCKPGYTQFQGTMGQRLHMSIADSLGMATRYGVAPPPILGGIAPLFVPVGSAAFTLWANCARVHAGTQDGQGVPGTRITWNGAPLSTTYFNQIIQTAQVPASLLTTAGYVTVRVDNPYPCPGPGGTATFEIRNPAPTLTSINPTSRTAGTATFTLTATGTNYNSQSVVRWNGSPLTTTYVSSTQLTASVPASLITTGGYASVTVNNPLPGGGATTSSTFTINNPVPAIGSMSPSSRPAGSIQFNVTVYVTAPTVYVPQSVVRWNGQALPSVFQGDHITATVSASLIATPGTATITVFNPTPGGGTSNPATFSITQPAPTLTSISPASQLVGGAAFTLTATGTAFTSQSVIRWNGTSLTTTYSSSTQLAASIAASFIATVGTASITVQTPAPGGGTSAVQTFSINNPLPSISSISPSSRMVGANQFTLTVDGSNLTSQSVVQWNGASRPTTYVNATRLTATISASLLTSAGTALITVQTPAPGGGSSNSQTFSINSPVPSISSVNPTSFIAGEGASTIDVYGNHLNSETVVRWNGVDLPTTLHGFFLNPHVTANVSASLLEAPGFVVLTLHNPAPGGGDSNSTAILIRGPFINSVTPGQIAVMGPTSPPVCISVDVDDVLPGAVFYANGVAVPTTACSGTPGLSIQIGPSIPQTQLTGGIAITVENGPHATSNARALVVGSGSNAGTTVTHPSLNPLPPGTPFSLVIEGGVVGAPFSILVDSSTAPVVTDWPTPAADLVLAVGTAELACPVDGIGLFQAAAGFAVLGTTQSLTGGSFTLPGLVTSNPPLGLARTLQIIYIDPTSPIGYRLSWAASPRFM